jgi:hypothetical protein
MSTSTSSRPLAADQPLPDSFWTGWTRLKAEYDRRLPA